MTDLLGFIGLGLMGSAIASRLQSRHPLLVWNRTRSATAPLVQAGAEVADSAADVFDRCATVFVLVTDERAVDEIVAPADLRQTTLVQMSTVRPAYSAELAARITTAGGRYVEAPVSGSRQPALNGALIGMLAGSPHAVDEVAPLLDPVCAMIVRCGEPPRAMQMKLAVNTFLITLVSGLAESFHFAETHELDVRLLEQILGAGPMASFVSRAKAAAIVAGDFAPQAAIPDVAKNARLVVAAARENGTTATLMDACLELYAETQALGHGGDDMAAVITAYRARTAGRRS
ncbi:NAD(P)-dependent oxidoreductase [Microbacterium sp. ET2]|uniref:NAD(P)-dependent oxidoreductase n=1 Tax=Microbacterium albipurpureum TaxID=3050384 RepID=UPI00259CEB9D|nr:NAD(P)-dependent oxidoreductase [Microbacterium sp. ET2 (Ac-2212)]WJL94928.1 NAD(P)-dependent oxidoreductase [Microbacterium sp. ET2 (Ac-2212)]